MEAGQLAYEAYILALGGSGRIRPYWAELGEHVRDAWRAAAHAAIQEGWRDAMAGRQQERQKPYD